MIGAANKIKAMFLNSLLDPFKEPFKVPLSRSLFLSSRIFGVSGERVSTRTYSLVDHFKEPLKEPLKVYSLIQGFLESPFSTRTWLSLLGHVASCRPAFKFRQNPTGSIYIRFGV